jgi:hypothetical protein
MRRILDKLVIILMIVILLSGTVSVILPIKVPPVSAASAPLMTWLDQFGTSSGDEITAVSSNSFGIFVAGNTGGTLPGQSKSGNTDAFVRRYDLSGGILWTRQFGTTGKTTVKGIAVDISGNVFVGGSTSGIFTNQTKHGGDDAFLCKYTKDGVLSWTRQFGLGGGEDLHNKVASLGLDNTGAIYVTCFSQLGVHPTQNIFVNKYDTSGSIIWTNSISSALSIPCMAVNSNGDVALVWEKFANFNWILSIFNKDGMRQSEFVLPNTSGFDYEHNAVAIDSSMNVYDIGSVQTPSYDAFIRKINRYGNEEWYRQFGTKGTDDANAIYLDSNSIYVSGITYDTFQGQNKTGIIDGFVRAYDLTGNDLWTYQFGSAGSISCGGITGGGAIGELVIAGSTDAAFVGKASYGGSDAFITRITTPFKSDSIEMKVISSANPSNNLFPITFTVTITPTSQQTPIPTGSISFYESTLLLATIPLNAGNISWETSILAVGNHTLTLVYSGDSNYAKNTIYYSQVINPANERLEDSVWAGYIVRPKSEKSNTIADVQGSWTVPAAIDGISGRFGCWVGIDGDGNNTVEQIGTAQGISLGYPYYYAWYQMVPDRPVNLDTKLYPVKVGDQMKAEVSYGADTAGQGQFTLSISNGETWSFTITLPEKPGTERKSAEWIVEKERFSPPPISTEFGNTHFSSASVTMSNQTGTIIGPQDTSIWKVIATGTSDCVATEIINGDSFDVKFVPAPKIALTSSVNPSKPGSYVTFTAIVSDVSSLGSIPTGYVEFKDQNNSLGMASLDSSGKATLSTFELSAGIHLIGAFYYGDNNFAFSNGSLWQTIELW